MNAARIFAGHEQAWQVGSAIIVDSNATHMKVSGRRDFDRLFSKVRSKVEAALDHAAEVLPDEIRPEMRDVEQHAILGGATAGHDLQKGATGDHVTGRSLL